MKKKTTAKKRVTKPAEERSYREIIASAGSDWVTSGIGIDAEVFQNVFSLRAAMRDLWRSNPYLAKYQEQLAANVFGEAGIMLRSKIKETEDRVVNTPDEKWALIAHERRIERIREWAQKKLGRPIESYRAFHLADQLDRSKSEHVIRGTATIQVGAPDVYANQRVEAWWQEWQKPANCDVRGRRDYNMLRQLRLWSCARDGGHFIRLIKDTKINRFGFAIQHVNDEWVDHFYNETLDNGNVVRMGIEYALTSWGIGKPIAFYFIKRMPRDWQALRCGTSIQWGGGRQYLGERDRIPAEEIIHYARFVDTESTRPAPWGVSALGKVRQLDQTEIAEVVAVRAEACKTGWLYSDLVPEGGITSQPCPEDAATMQVTPGGLYGLPWGVKYQSNDPTHPSGNFESFRKGMGRSVCAAFPGADYNTIFNDLEGINFSAGRLGRLDKNEICRMLLTTFDIPTAERPIFEAGLEMALIIGAIPLPLAKFFKFNKPTFYGPGFDQVDEVKAGSAAAIRIANKLSSRTKECAQIGVDFDDNAAELAEEEITLERYGLRQETTAQNPLPATAGAATSEDNADAAATGSIQSTALNGAQIIALIEIVGKVTSGEISMEAANALISAAFPLMTEEEINAIVSQLTVTKLDQQDTADETDDVIVDDNPKKPAKGNGKHLPAIDKDTRLALNP